MERRKKETVGFGFEPGGGGYHFVVEIPPRGEGPVTASEHFVYGESVEEAASRARFSDDPNRPIVRPPNPKVEIAYGKWERVAEEARAEFNRRLLGAGMSKSAWKPGENRLAPFLGRELVLLLWAMEDADPGSIPNILANWQGLAPEERWWLYTTINATSGHASQGRGRGWRKAIGIAFAENDVTHSDAGSGYFSSRQAGGSRVTRRGGGRRAAAEEDQPPQLPFEDGADRS